MGLRVWIALASLITAAANASASDGIAVETSFDCLIEPKMTVMVGAPTQGVINSVSVQRSQLVEQGQLLATLESEVEQAALRHAEVKADMVSEIQAREADLSLAKANMSRIIELYHKGVVSSQQKDEVSAQLQVARMAVKQAKDNKRLYGHEYTQAKEVLAQHEIRSPITGVVVEQRAFPGEFVYENPVVSIAQIHPLKVEAILPVRHFGSVQVGMKAEVVPEVATDDPILVTVSGVDRVIDLASGTFSVYLELPNPDYRIPGGQRCTLAIKGTSADDQIASISSR